MTFRKVLLSTTLAALCSASAGQAAVVIYTWEEAGDVASVFSGTLDTTGISFAPFSGSAHLFYASNNGFVSLGDDFDFTNALAGWSSGSAGGGGPTSEASSHFGDTLGVSDTELSLNVGYVSGSFFSGGMTFVGETLASLGLVAGEVVYTAPSADTITWKIGMAPPLPPEVPLPATLPLAMGALAGLGWLRRRRR